MMCAFRVILLSILGYLFFVSGYAQTFSDGPMRLQVRVAYVYVDDFHDVLADQEAVWYVYARDDASQDGLNWRNSYGCIQQNCFCSGWLGGPGAITPEIIIMNHNYSGTTVPARVDFEMESWEDDNGTDCAYDGPCSICIDPDDAHCGRGTLANNVYYRDAGPPCEWVGSDDTAWNPWDFGMCSNSWGVGIQFKWEYTGSVTGTYTWRGRNSTNWFEACNWSTNTVPTLARNVVIPTSGDYDNAPTIPSGTALCNTIDIKGDGELTINTAAGAVLLVNL
jgi:hypothetical protein